ncbi:hypothetical protein [Sulfobacillus sp. hq2]|uniref:hypothetical protein n=1 Tax=Sulfobacillus TaxID=28033 RepID=UPI000CD2DB71|nr:hypothetical protein [Sulfobacillus sp. hq2]POB09372.1 hypothetical protein CO251_14080 [Sulfobacillus sp. hq2]
MSQNVNERLNVAMHLKRLSVSLIVLGLWFVALGPLAYAKASGFHKIGVVDGHVIWVNILSSNGKAVPWTHRVWSKNGNTTTDQYIFSINTPSNIKMEVKFSLLGRGRELARIMTMQDTQGHHHLVMAYTLQTRSGYWITRGKTNYDLVVNQFQDKKLLWTTRVGEYIPGVPQWQSGSLIAKKSVGYGVPRFEGTVRLPNAPVFHVQKPFWPEFPYLGFGEDKNINWFVENPSPLYFDLNTNIILQFPFVGFEEAGMYRFNSLTYPPFVDFESPFAFYGYSQSRYAQEVIRAQQFPKHDPYAPEHVERQQSYFRMSWKMENPDLWRYSLEVQGFYGFNHAYRIGSVRVYAPNPHTYGQWVVSKKWPYVSFVQAMNGYSGSEGIYFDSGSSADSVWPWLDGLTNQVPPYLSHPYLVNSDTLTRVSSEALPKGYRVDTNAAYLQKPRLYINRIDNLVHLWNATQGVENLGHNSVLRFEDLNGGHVFDGWLRETRHKKTWAIMSQLYSVGHFLIYAGRGRVDLLPYSLDPVVSMVPVPTNKTTWEKFVSQVKPYETGRNPWDLQSWITSVRGTSTVLSSATFSHVQISQGAFRADLWVKPGNNTTHGPLTKTFNLKPGHYIVMYNIKKQAWSATAGAIPDFTAHVQIGHTGVLYAGQPYKVKVTISNHSGIALRSHIQLKVNGITEVVPATSVVSVRMSFIRYIKFPVGSQVEVDITDNGKMIYRDDESVLPDHRLANAYLYVLGNRTSEFWAWVIGLLGLGIAGLVSLGWTRIISTRTSLHGRRKTTH